LYKVPVVIETHVVTPTSYPVRVIVFELYDVWIVAPVMEGKTGLIQYTLAMLSQVLNPSSLYVKVNIPFVVKVYPLNQPLLVMTMGSETPVKVARTEPLVADHDHGA
jgi:hypothetical protein